MKHGIWATVRGRVTYRPDRKTVGDQVVCSLVLTVEMKRGPQRVRVAAWNDLAATAAGVEKGTDIEVSGWLRLGCWTGRDGVEHHEFHVTAEEISEGGQDV